MEMGESYIAPHPIKLPSLIRDWAETYDRSGEIPNKAQHRPFLYGDHPPTLNKPFELWFKAFIAKAWFDRQIKIHITSAFRTVGQQEELRAKYLARKEANPNDKSKWGLPASCGTCSRHIGGSAIDLNFSIMGVNFTSKQDKATWEANHLPGIGRELGLKWGGDFTHYDPVHFEIAKPFGDVDINPQEFFAQNAGKTVKYDTVDTGRTTSERQRDEELIAGGETSDNSDIRDDLDDRLGESSTSE